MGYGSTIGQRAGKVSQRLSYGMGLEVSHAVSRNDSARDW